jgi:hypothetical protein
LHERFKNHQYFASYPGYSHDILSIKNIVFYIGTFGFFYVFGFTFFAHSKMAGKKKEFQNLLVFQ